jgi:type IV pilus assembly protein PilC
MSMYEFRALDASGRIVKGSRDAINELELESALASNGMTLINATIKKSKRLTATRTLSRREAIDFFYYLEMLFKAGVPLVEALKDLGESAGTTGVRQASQSTADAIMKGEQLAGALAASQAFNEEFVKLIATGEQSGTLSTVLSEIVRSLKWRDELASRTKKALMYPAFALVVIIGAVTFLMSYVVPQIIQFILSMDNELPIYTKALIAVSDFIGNWWVETLAAPFVLWFVTGVMAKSNRDFKKFLHAQFLNIPLIGSLLKKIILARVVDTLALMYRSGVPILDALEQVADVVSNLAIKDSLTNARTKVAEGVPMSVAFGEEDMFPPLVVRMLRVGENTGALDDALNNVSYFYIRDIDDAVSKVQSSIEPILTMVLGLTLGWIMLAVLGPIYDTISKIKI